MEMQYVCYLEVGIQLTYVKYVHKESNSKGWILKYLYSHSSEGDVSMTWCTAPHFAYKTSTFYLIPTGNPGFCHTALQSMALTQFYSSRFLNRASCFTYVRRTNKMYNFVINDWIQLYCLRHVLHNYVFITRKSVQAALRNFIMHLYEQSSCWQIVFDTRSFIRSLWPKFYSGFTNGTMDRWWWHSG
jgi:hypothetical protein